MSQGTIIYLAVVGGIAVLVTARILWWLKAAEIRNLRVFKRQVDQQPIQTSGPVDDPAAVADKQVSEAIATRFSVTRRLLIPIVAVIAAALAALPFLDMVPAASVSLVVGAVTVVAGLALRPVIENAIAGLVISSSKLISVGDTLVIEDHYGTVEDISTTHTTIKLWDWRRYVVSNTNMLQTEFLNFTLWDQFIWAYIVFYVDYSADLDEVERLVAEAAKSSPAYADYEEPRFWIIDTTPDAVLCWAAAWTEGPSDAWRLKHDMRKHLIPELAKRGWAPRAHRVAGIRDMAPVPESRALDPLAADLDRQPKQQ